MPEEAAKRQITVERELEEIIPGYLANRHKDILQLTDLLGKEDFETMRVLGHRMKGSGAGYGLDEISRIGAAMEQAARGQHSAELTALIQELTLYLDRLEIVYQ
ncbi:MAG: Hpt domain-containing protein [Magnetococcales bacterium]|nr:Hpt domain-containing protein [Magnetococcales bacterium]